MGNERDSRLGERMSALGQSVAIGGRTAPSRLAFPAHPTNYAFEYRVSDTAVAYYEERVRFGAGAVTAAPDNVDPRFLSRGTVLASDPDVVPGYRSLAEAVQRHGALVFGSLMHPGSGAVGDLTANWALELAPSAVRPGPGARVPRPLEVDEIGEIVELFGTSAAHQAEAGLDGTELDVGIGLAADFMSTTTNRRDDAYGGSLEGRVRFVAEVLAEIRRATGPDHLLGLRLSLPVEGEVLEALAALEGPDYVVLDAAGDAVAAAAAAATLRSGEERTAIVILDSTSGAEVEEALELEGVDLVGLTDALVADPEWPTKLDAGEALLRARPCTGCGDCRYAVAAGAALTCTVNPAAGRELKWAVGSIAAVSPEEAKDIVVVGAGPAGLKAAETAARAGHRVTLVERAEAVGGLLDTISGLPGCADCREARDWLSDLVGELGVEVLLERRIDAAGVSRSGERVQLLAESTGGDAPLTVAADAVVVATGAAPVVPEVEAEVFDAVAVAEGRAEVGRRVVVIDVEAKQAGAATAAKLIGEGHEVTLATPGLAIAAGVPGSARQDLLGGLYSGGAELLTGTALAGARDGEVTLQNVFTGEERSLEADTVVAAMPPRSGDELYWCLHDLGATVLRAGDCVAPRHLAMAFFSGEETGRNVSRPGGPLLPPIVEDKGPVMP